MTGNQTFTLKISPIMISSAIGIAPLSSCAVLKRPVE